MSEMDGISALNALQELYVSYNELHELNPLCMLERLRVLDLEGKTLSLSNLLALRSLCSFFVLIYNLPSLAPVTINYLKTVHCGKSGCHAAFNSKKVNT